MSNRWDASNSVRYCAHCESEQGAGIADPGDRACAACGQHDAPHVYVPLATHQGAVALAREAADLLDELTVYWETQDLPPEVQDTFDDVRRRLTADGGQ